MRRISLFNLCLLLLGLLIVVPLFFFVLTREGIVCGPLQLIRIVAPKLYMGSSPHLFLRSR